MYTDEEGDRYVKRSVTSRILAAVVGVVMLGYATIMITQALEFTLPLQSFGVAPEAGLVPGGHPFRSLRRGDRSGSPAGELTRPGRRL